MQKIAVLDDDEHWCHTIKRFFRNDFEVTTFQDVQTFLDSPIESYDLIIVDFTITPSHRYEQEKTGIEIINQLRIRLKKPPKLVLTSAFISKNDSGIAANISNIADQILPKDLGLDQILQSIKNLLRVEHPS
ncbi:hypothetical protein [Leptothermofonsia sp. ETS-13]|uniref:hypothetical protein n=1 Tax=Leptothermofonsia sp. ETS-13 TaxID=3035696 RepID=UPI003BA05080